MTVSNEIQEEQDVINEWSERANLDELGDMTAYKLVLYNSKNDKKFYPSSEEFDTAVDCFEEWALEHYTEITDIWQSEELHNFITDYFSDNSK